MTKKHPSRILFVFISGAIIHTDIDEKGQEVVHKHAEHAMNYVHHDHNNHTEMTQTPFVGKPLRLMGF